MALITVQRSRIFGNPLHVLLLDDLTRRYRATVACVTKSLQFVQDPDDLANMHDIALPSAGDWAEFKKWCNAQGITANLKNKQIDGSKTWWPCIIELIIRDHSDANILLIKLRHLY